MTCVTPSRALASAALITLLSTLAIAPAMAEPAPVAPVVTVTPTLRLVGHGALSAKKAGVWNKAKAGSTVPLKFRIYEADGSKVKTRAAVSTFSAAPVSCTDKTALTSPAPIDLLSVTRKGFALKYRNGAFHENWKTPKATTVKVKVKGTHKTVATPACYQVSMTAVDGQALTAFFKLK